jgi:hypothetical protein
MNLRSYIAPIVLTVLTLILGFYLLLRSTPVINSVNPESAAIDADVLQYFSVIADQYSKEGTKIRSTQSNKMAEQI